MIRFSSLSVPVLAGALVTTALPAQAHHWSNGHYNQGPALRPQMVQSYPYEPAPYPYERSPNINSAGDGWMQTQLERDCRRGRLIGDIVGGGLGYVASRDDGRSWAVPLGALLGSQVGCNAGSGRRPLPW